MTVNEEPFKHYLNCISPVENETARRMLETFTSRHLTSIYDEQRAREDFAALVVHIGHMCCLHPGNIHKYSTFKFVSSTSEICNEIVSPKYSITTENINMLREELETLIKRLGTKHDSRKGENKELVVMDDYRSRVAKDFDPYAGRFLGSLLETLCHPKADTGKGAFFMAVVEAGEIIPLLESQIWSKDQIKLLKCCRDEICHMSLEKICRIFDPQYESYMDKARVEFFGFLAGHNSKASQEGQDHLSAVKDLIKLISKEQDTTYRATETRVKLNTFANEIDDCQQPDESNNSYLRKHGQHYSKSNVKPTMSTSKNGNAGSVSTSFPPPEDYNEEKFRKLKKEKEEYVKKRNNFDKVRQVVRDLSSSDLKEIILTRKIVNEHISSNTYDKEKAIALKEQLEKICTELFQEKKKNKIIAMKKAMEQLLKFFNLKFSSNCYGHFEVHGARTVIDNETALFQHLLTYIEQDSHKTLSQAARFLVMFIAGSYTELCSHEHRGSQYTLFRHIRNFHAHAHRLYKKPLMSGRHDYDQATTYNSDKELADHVAIVAWTLCPILWPIREVRD